VVVSKRKPHAADALAALGKALKIPVLGVLAGLMCCAAAAAAAEVANFRLLKLGGNRVHWQNAITGEGPVVSYGFVKETREFTGARNCRKLTSLNGLATSSQLAKDVIEREINGAFAMWQAAANINFREAETSSMADILIGAQVEPEGWAFTNVFYDARSADATKPISQSLICLNPLKPWKVGFDGNLKSYDLRYTIAHEIGHAIGLDHPDADGQIMGFRYEEDFRELQLGDVAGAVLLYGRRLPQANTAEADPLHPDTRRSSPVRAKRSGTRAIRAPAAYVAPARTNDNHPADPLSATGTE
jgi:predicted Zn-dependent protease